MSQQKYPYHEFSGAVQQKSTTHIKKPNEVIAGYNTDFWSVLGAMRRRPGAQSTVASMPKLPVNAPALGAFIARFDDSEEIWAAQNDHATTPTEATLAYWTGPTATDWVEIEDGISSGSEVNMIDDLDEIWVSSYDPVLDTIGTSFTVDDTHNVSQTRHLAYGPEARFFIEFNGSMWAADCLVEGARYRDRLYKSSGPTGAVALIRSAQTDPQGDFELINQIPIMTSNTAPAGTAAANSEHASGHLAWKPMGGGIADPRWVTNSGATGWIRYDFGSGNTKVITHYAMIGHATGMVDPTRAPKTWTFEGSNDPTFVSWTVIDTQTNVASWSTGEKRTYSTANTTAYRWYRINISLNQGDVLLKLDGLEFLNSTANVDLLEVEIDSVRYLKPGMEIDIYEAGTETKLYDITITAVNKILDTISFLPHTQNFVTGDVNTTTEVITLPNAAQFTTGTAIIFGSTGTVPAGLTAGVTYYAINVSSTTIKVATSALNASIGNAINLTSTGSGNHRVRLSYVFGNKDEIWKDGRKGMLTRYWNTDYRNPEASDWLKLPPTFNGANGITAVAKTVNRLFVWTIGAMFRYDSQNFKPLRNDVGCVAQKTIAFYDSFMVWLDAKGRVWIRNDESGQQDIISNAIKDIMALVPQMQLPDASAICVDDTYKLYLGQIDGKTLRVCYNFKTNQWTDEWFTPMMPIQIEYQYAGNFKPHFFDQTGQMWVDEQGTDDNGQAIHMAPELGNDTFGVDEQKNFYGVKVYSHNSASTKIYASVDDGDWQEVGQITKPVQAILLNKVPKGTMINFKFGNSFLGDTPQIDKMVVWFNREEDTFRATAK